MVNLLKKIFSDRAFCITITDADFGNLNSLHTLFDKYLGQMLVKFEQNCIEQNIQNFEGFFFPLQKMVNHLVLTPFWKTFCETNNCSMLKY